MLRRIFVRITQSSDKITVTRGIIFRRSFSIPLCAITRLDVVRTPLLRLLRGKRVEIKTLRGGIYFYLNASEKNPFAHEFGEPLLKATAAQSIIGAFVDTRALSVVITFALLLKRIGSVFGEHLDKIITRVLSGTAEEVQKTLSALNIAVPRITAFSAVFVGAAWLSAFIARLLGMSRFRLYRSKDLIAVRRGTITLRESFFPRDKLIPVRRDTPTTLLLRLAPVYAHGAILFPAAKKELLTKICGVSSTYSDLNLKRIKPRNSAFFAHCAVPLGFFAVFSVILAATYKVDVFIIGEITRSFLWLGAIISFWYAATFALYMRRSGLLRRKGAAEISCRRGTRLYTAVIPDKYISSAVIRQSPFQRRSKTWSITLVCAEELRLTVWSMGGYYPPDTHRASAH